MCSQHKAATDQLLCIGRPVPLTSILISQYKLFSHTPATKQICWHLGKDGSYPGWRPGKDWPGSERVEWYVEVMLIALCLSTDRCIVMDG